VNLLKAKSQFYYSLSTMVQAGVHTVRALRQHHPPPFQRVSRIMATQIEHGEGDLGRLMEQWPRIFSPMESRLVSVGQRSGRLDTVYSALAEWFDLLARLRSEIISRLLYPALMYTAAAILIPLITVFIGHSSPAHAVMVSLTALALPVALYLALKSGGRFGAAYHAGPAIADSLLLQVPVLGNTLRKLNYARYFRAYALALNAGVHVPEAIRLAADTCTNRTMNRRLREMADTVETEGCTFVEAFRRHSGTLIHDDLITTVLETGEESGSIVETAERLADVYWREAEQAMQRSAVVLPMLVYLALVAYMAYMIINLWGSLIQMTTQLTE